MSMRNCPVRCLAALSAVALTTTSVAYAQELAPEPYTADEPVDSYLDLAPRNAFELGIQGGYTQPFGEIQDGRPIGDVADAGGEVALELNWRISPRFAFGGTARYHESVVDDSAGDRLDVRGGSANLQGTFHFAPYSFVDPYLTLGAGYRAFSIVPEGPQPWRTSHGFELGRAQVGLDFRVARDVSIGPNVGATVNMFFWEDQENAADRNIEEPRPNTFLFAGLAGRFDIGGDRVSRGVYYGEYPATRTTYGSR